MAITRQLALIVTALLPMGGYAQSPTGDTPPGAMIDHIDLVAGTPVQFATVDELSSKRQAKGDRIALKTVGDTLVNGRIVIPADSVAVGEISDGRGTGGLGVGGKLAISPLYISIGGTTIRFSGTRLTKPGTGVDTVLGLAVIGVFSGKTAVVPAGTRIEGYVLHTVSLPLPKI